MKQLFLLLALVLAGCATTTPKPEIQRTGNDKILEDGVAVLIEQRFPKKAIEEYFNVVVASCEELFANSETTYFASRDVTESVFYMLQSSVNEEPAQVIAPTCADAYYLKGYAYVDLGDIAQAQVFVEKALELSPLNSQYRSELGQILQLQQDWSGALEAFELSAENAETFSPEPIRVAELGRAMRGIGFNLIELGRLDEAEAKFQECLELDPNDVGAKQELEYIRTLREQADP